MNDVVLVVEADRTLQKMLVQRLHVAGFAPVPTSTWEEALQLVRLGLAVDLIFLGPTIAVDEGCSEPAVAHIPLVLLPPDPWPTINRFTIDTSVRHAMPP